jgi:hypothetical protein
MYDFVLSDTCGLVHAIRRAGERWCFPLITNEKECEV